MLWTLLTLISSATFIAGAVESAQNAAADVGGYVLAITIGLLLGVCNALTPELCTSRQRVARLTP
jgi:hypothetical protein